MCASRYSGEDYKRAFTQMGALMKEVSDVDYCRFIMSGAFKFAIRVHLTSTRYFNFASVMSAFHFHMQALHLATLRSLTKLV